MEGGNLIQNQKGGGSSEKRKAKARALVELFSYVEGEIFYFKILALHQI